MVCSIVAKYPGTGKRRIMVTIPTIALENEMDGVKLVSLESVKLIDTPPAQDGIQEQNTKGDLNGAGDSDHEEIPSIDDVVQVRRDEVVDLSDKVSALLPSRFLLLSLGACLVCLRRGW